MTWWRWRRRWRWRWKWWRRGGGGAAGAAGACCSVATTRLSSTALASAPAMCSRPCALVAMLCTTCRILSPSAPCWLSMPPTSADARPASSASSELIPSASSNFCAVPASQSSRWPMSLALCVLCNACSSSSPIARLPCASISCLRSSEGSASVSAMRRSMSSAEESRRARPAAPPSVSSPSGVALIERSDDETSSSSCDHRPGLMLLLACRQSALAVLRSGASSSAPVRPARGAGTDGERDDGDTAAKEGFLAGLAAAPAEELAVSLVGPPRLLLLRCEGGAGSAPAFAACEWPLRRPSIPGAESDPRCDGAVTVGPRGDLLCVPSCGNKHRDLT